MITAARTRKSSHTAKVEKIVHIIARIQFIADACKVVYKVRSSDGTQQYETYLFDGKATSCTCPAKKPCYHMVQVQAKEIERTLRLWDEQEQELVQAEFPYGSAVVVPEYAGTTGIVVSDVYRNQDTQLLCVLVDVDGVTQCFTVSQLQDAEQAACVARAVRAEAEQEKIDAEEYAAWKREMGLDGVIDRATYVEMFDPDGLYQ
jgi:hypothetical protein